eukprot:CAMPEP_0198281856 /NCGR_PEP_ID=MMETSP1449-20131203/1736_1 /TAXON_ID=420275 /ORGANISM="Attheya septentrionalis, Strain CCMP2084" /LENGTH=1094 /DNA_ID=CAMNT_0043977825 /DNA_START=130 /DNA_END=3414 /DNA_ORIENTATION=-
MEELTATTGTAEQTGVEIIMNPEIASTAVAQCPEEEDINSDDDELNNTNNDQEMDDMQPSKKDDKWMEMWQQLVVYKEEHGHSNAPKSYNVKLARWIKRQREVYKEDQQQQQQQQQQAGDMTTMSATTMTAFRLQKLQSLDFNFTGLQQDAYLQAWQDHYNELTEFKEEYGHCNVPKSMGILGRWVHKQRELFRRRSESLLTIANNSNDNNDTNSPAANKDGPSTGSLTEERVKLLNALGMEWVRNASAGTTQLWNQMIQRLRDFHSKHGHCNVPLDYMEDNIATIEEGGEADKTSSVVESNSSKQSSAVNAPKSLPSLAAWVEQQRFVYRQLNLDDDLEENSNEMDSNSNRKGMSESASVILTPERLMTLHAIGFTFLENNATEFQWFSMFVRLKAFSSQTEQSGVVSPDDVKILYSWMERQRYLLTQDKLSPYKEHLLRYINFAVDDEQALEPAKVGTTETSWEGGPDLDNTGHFEDAGDSGYNPDTTGIEGGNHSISSTMLGQAIKHDVVFQLRLDELREFKKKEGHLQVPLANLPLGRWVRSTLKQFHLYQSDQTSKLTSEQVDMLKEVGMEWNETDELEDLRAWNDKTWNKHYETLKQYHVENGHCRVPQNYHDKQLATWVKKQRAAGLAFMENKTKRSTTQDRMDKLRALNFEFSVLQVYDWDDMYQELLKFHKKNEHTNVPCSYLTDSGKSLRKWVAIQRTAHQRFLSGSKRVRITPEQVEKLNALGAFEVNSKRGRKAEGATTDNESPAKKRHKQVKPAMNNTEKWMNRYLELKAYKEKFGDCLVPLNYTTNGPLGWWVRSQRKAYLVKNEDGSVPTLTDERIKLLTDIGFSWQKTRRHKFVKNIESGDGEQLVTVLLSIKNTDLFEKRVIELEAYKKQHGNLLVPKSYPVLGRWVKQQRLKFKQMMEGNRPSNFSDDQINILKGLGFVFQVRYGSLDDIWKRRLEELKQFKQEHGDCLVPKSYENQELARWVRKQRELGKWRMDGKPSPMTDERMELLESLGFAFSVRMDQRKYPKNRKSRVSNSKAQDDEGETPAQTTQQDDRNQGEVNEGEELEASNLVIAPIVLAQEEALSARNTSIDTAEV